jgi:hypothetical protein
MNRDDIIRMAREAGFADGAVDIIGLDGFANFANLVAAAERERLEATAWGASQKWIERAIETEREACAQLVEQAGIDGYGTLAAAAMIRARGQA